MGILVRAPLRVQHPEMRSEDVTETSAERRARILLNSPDTSAFDFDSAVALGYEPESWDGMWKLPADRPIIWLTRNWAIVREVAYIPGTHIPRCSRNGVRLKMRLKRRETKPTTNNA